MKNVVRLEELAMFLLAVFVFAQTAFAWWWFPLLLLVPDLSMIGYAFGNKTGAVVYNIFHHKATAIGVFIAGSLAGIPWLELAGIILFAHSSMDRIFGYGLKFSDSFKHTHLARIGGE
ncbi:MAG TPA: DUF4260 domain-containing protein [Balneolaceae bacterium]|nr:DUF4260 domain-containing protein [Balneolaceae bacterium]